MLTSVDLNKANGHPIAVEGDSAMSIHDGQWYRVCSRSKWAHTVSKLSRFLWQGKNKFFGQSLWRTTSDERKKKLSVL